MSIDIVEVRLNGKQVGGLAWDKSRGYSEFNYSDSFINSGLSVSPFMAPLDDSLYPGKRGETYQGLPEFIADSLPDRFGNAIINAYFDKKGIRQPDLTPLDRLAYIGERAMGALTYHPAVDHLEQGESQIIELSSLVSAARRALSGNLTEDSDQATQALNKLLSVGISAGGARAKAVINYNPQTGEMTSGQFDAKPGFEPWLIKFDGVGTDLALGSSERYGRIEQAYHLMAKAAGIEMSESMLLNENGRSHFMTRRFDRNHDKRIHMQSYCAMKGVDFNLRNTHSYEQFFATVQELTEDARQVEQAIKRAFFNVLARNQDDHTKNLSFLMNNQGEWRLSPAFDVTYAFNPNDGWTSNHQMSLNGKFNHFEADDLIRSAKDFMSENKAIELIEEVANAIERWPEFAATAELNEQHIEHIAEHHRVERILSTLINGPR